MTDLMTFDEAIDDSEKYRRRHLLLGNGFSIACLPHIFRYKSLLEKADFDGHKILEDLFKVLKTSDFEKVIDALENKSKIFRYLNTEGEIDYQTEFEGEHLKKILIQTIAKVHPKTPDEISISQYKSCKRFLEHFIGYKNGDGRVFTLNYDLLLYWAIISDSGHKRSGIKLATNDGFSRDDETDADYVKWIGNHANRSPQQIHYLHGALHLFYSEDILQKYTWRYTGKSLLEQVKEAMSVGKFPLFVTEGTSKDKMLKISREPYLYFALQSFRSQMDIPESSLFVFGFSFSSNDDHIIKEIRKGKIRKMYVGLFANADPKEVSKTRMVVNELKHSRSDGYPIDVEFFDSASTRVWNS